MRVPGGGKPRPPPGADGPEPVARGLPAGVSPARPAERDTMTPAPGCSGLTGLARSDMWTSPLTPLSWDRRLSKETDVVCDADVAYGRCGPERRGISPNRDPSAGVSSSRGAAPVTSAPTRCPRAILSDGPRNLFRFCSFKGSECSQVDIGLIRTRLRISALRMADVTGQSDRVPSERGDPPEAVRPYCAMNRA